MADKKTINVTICGGGNGAHVLAGLSSMEQELKVTVVDVYMDESKRWTDALEQHGFAVNFPNGAKVQQPAGSVRFTVTKEPKSVSNADIVIICVPAFTHLTYLNIIAPLLQDSTLVVGMPGQAGFEFQCKTILQENGKRCAFMALSTLPWACRIKNYGKEVEVFGTKDEVEYSFIRTAGEKASNPAAVPETVQKLLGERPVLKSVDNVLQLTLASKGSIHPPILYSKWRNWDGTPLLTPPLFYQGSDEEAADCLGQVADEILNAAREIQRRFPHLDFSGLLTMHQWLVSSYGDQIKDQTSLLSSLKTNAAYDGLCHPTAKTEDGKYVPDFTYRYLSEDIPYGLLVLRQIASFVDVATPRLNDVIQWAQTKLNMQFMEGGKLLAGDRMTTRLPSCYGINSIEELVHFFDN